VQVLLQRIPRRRFNQHEGADTFQHISNMLTGADGITHLMQRIKNGDESIIVT
jgi:hypothetical protein